MSIDDLPPSSGEHTESTQGSVVVALRTRPFLPAELEHAGEEVPKRGVTVEGGKDMIVKLQVKKVSPLRGRTTRRGGWRRADAAELTVGQVRPMRLTACLSLRLLVPVEWYSDQGGALHRRRPCVRAGSDE